MSGLLSYVPGLAGGSQPKARAIGVAPVQVHQIETNPDRRARCLKHLLKANHVNYAIALNELLFVNHNAHLLSTAYLFGANEAQLHALYEEEIKKLEPWAPSPAEIVDLDWRDFLGDKRYQRAYVDFFEDKLAMTFAYDWKQEVAHFLFTGDTPLLHGLIGGLGHPLIHLGYAYEMDCKELAMEALGLACIEFDSLHKYTADPSYTKLSPLAPSSPPDLLQLMSRDVRFNKLPKSIHYDKLGAFVDEYQDLIMDYWNAWVIEEPLKQFQLSQEAAVSLLVATVEPGTHAYNFFLVHLLTASHAVRVLLPFIPAQHHITLVREWWLLAIIIFIMKGRRRPDPQNLDEVGGKDWAYLEKQVLTSQWSKDAHYIKAIRAMREAARTWGDAQQTYLKAAVTFVNNFDEWKF
ncbi:hypothetical protein CDD83_6588 [Cordyceps sp. RAO-2017]|nr:hypothetical protein CDD83_6588 [Cordyceps sp. RAO-2017]